ncbi:hypothetical protein AB6D11_01030 [Vibrio splendidus]
MKEIDAIINKHRKAKDLAVAMNMMFWLTAALWVFNVVNVVMEPFGLEVITPLGLTIISLNLVLTGTLYHFNAPYRQLYGFFGQRTYTSLSAIPPWPSVWFTQPLRKLKPSEYTTLRFEFEEQPALMETLNCGGLTVEDALKLHIHHFVYYGPAKNRKS